MTLSTDVAQQSRSQGVWYTFLTMVTLRAEVTQCSGWRDVGQPLYHWDPVLPKVAAALKIGTGAWT